MADRREREEATGIPVSVYEEAAQLKQQRDALFRAIAEHKSEWDEMYWDKSPDTKTEPQLAAVWKGDQKLYQAASLIGEKGDRERQ